MTDINDVIKTIDELIDGGVLTQYVIAREAGISDGTLSAFRKGKYKGDNAAVAASLRSWYENWNKQSALPEPPQFVETQTVQELRALFQAVRLMGCINVIVGIPGVGKTATARNYCQEQPNTWMITLSPAHSSVTECLLELADALGIDYTRANKGALSRAIRRRLMGTRGLVIVDEADHLGIDGLEQLRAIQDATDCLRGDAAPLMIYRACSAVLPVQNNFARPKRRMCWLLPGRGVSVVRPSWLSCRLSLKNREHYVF